MSYRKVFELWWPLAGSWLLMGIELPIVSAVMARLADPEIHLAAYGGVVFPLALIIEAPVIMLLAASTALSKDWTSYAFLRRFTVLLACVLTVLHIVVAFSPLYDWVVSGILGAPEQIREPARIGLMIMTPWTAAIAIRRFQQGVLIRYGKTRLIGVGTACRLAANMGVLGVGLLWGTIPGIIVTTVAVSLGVLTEALFVYVQVQPLLARMKVEVGDDTAQLTMSRLLTFYVPLAMTSLLALLALPIGSAALSRMPRALDSLAVWPVMAGISFSLRSLGLAFQEVVVALLGTPGSVKILRNFAVGLGCCTSCLLLIIAATPLARLYFGDVAGLSPELTELGSQAIWLACLLPGLSAFESFLQGRLVHGHQTRCITEAVVIYLIASACILVSGTYYGHITGLYVGVLAVSTGLVCQTLWLLFRNWAMISSDSIDHSVKI
ncbi:MAG: hypothetical protein MRJ96_08400 [Nitrospirales bacterium]|nr:hypothetical protein [Nitrospira sp.]MDR4501453.1 hypothetical protein [Nitrospirales bacterium]